MIVYLSLDGAKVQSFFSEANQAIHFNIVFLEEREIDFRQMKFRKIEVG
ncbi:hypothetical protein GTZ96_006015 [Flavobacterium sp. BBQ-18]|nr:hypothetical protein [Flavobacterium undicola]